MYENLAVLAVFVFIYSSTAGRIEKMPISGPIIFILFGLLCGSFGLNILKLDIGGEGLSSLAEFTLALVLFTDAATANLVVLRDNVQIPVRLLLVGLPLTILLGYGAGLLTMQEFSPIELAVLATMLAPTDAALGKAVVTNPLVLPKIREALNVESGLNDGICVPILFLFLALATGSGAHEGTGQLTVKLVAEQIGIGLVVGITLTSLATFALHYFISKNWLTATWHQLPVLTLAISCFAVAQLLGGSGFIASFVGGILFGSLTTKHKDAKHALLMAAEGTGDTLALATWVVFGAVVIPKVFIELDWRVILYAALSLTVVRMLPVYLCLLGTGLSNSAKLFMGWFGPRGLASIVFAVIVLNEGLPHGKTLVVVVICTVVLSVVGHGFSANPLSKSLFLPKKTGSSSNTL